MTTAPEDCSSPISIESEGISVDFSRATSCTRDAWVRGLARLLQMFGEVVPAGLQELALALSGADAVDRRLFTGTIKQ